MFRRIGGRTAKVVDFQHNLPHFPNYCLPSLAAVDKNGQLLLGAEAAKYLIDFSWAFTMFHKLFFRNDYWIFDPRIDPIIIALPEELFMICGGAILILLVIRIRFALLSFLSFFCLFWHIYTDSKAYFLDTAPKIILRTGHSAFHRRCESLFLQQFSVRT